MQKAKHSRGFTLIEMMFAISIISLLAGVILANTQSVRERANDAARLANLNDMRVALRLYAQANGHYPYSECQLQTNGEASWWIGYGGSWGAHQGCATNEGSPTAGTNEAMLAPYISQAIKDPTSPMLNSGANPDAGYIYTSDGESYCLMAYKLPQNMNNYPQETWNMHPGRCGSVNPNTGQCSSGNNSVFYSQISPSDAFAASQNWATGC